MKKNLLLILALLLLSDVSFAQIKNDSASVFGYQSLKTKVLKDTSISVYKNKPTAFNTKRDFVKIGSMGAVILGSAVSTIRLKQIANDAYDTYLNTHSQSDLDKSNRYDKYSLVTLIIMEAAFAGLVYLLFFD